MYYFPNVFKFSCWCGVNKSNSEISKLECIISSLREYLIDNPDDLAVKMEISTKHKNNGKLNDRFSLHIFNKIIYNNRRVINMYCISSNPFFF